ncbi:UNVERIFIED_CONTAM: hypothetical protein RMT77_001272 [Armadillidium vulgare]
MIRLALWKVLVFTFPLLEGKPVSQVLEATGRYPHEYVLKDEQLYDHQNPAVLEYYDVQEPYEDKIVYDYVQDVPPAKSNYEFAYGVEDDKHGTAYSRKESSDGKGTKGQYQVHLPDGRIQTVIYSADEHGYRAQVLYEGEAVHDEPKSHPNAIPHPQPVKKLQKEEKVHEIYSDPPVYQGSGQYFGSPAARFDGHHSPHLGIGHHSNSLHSYPHVTDFPFSPVAPASAPIGHHPYVTAPIHGAAPHPHPVIQTHGAHPFHNFYETAASHLNNIHPEVANAAYAVNRPLFRTDVDDTQSRFTRDTKISEDSTARPFLLNKK